MLDYETRKKIKEAINEHKRNSVKKSSGVRFASENREERKRRLYKKPCLICGIKLCWHPPHGKGKCIGCAVRETIPNRKSRTSRKSGT